MSSSGPIYHLCRLCTDYMQTPCVLSSLLRWLFLVVHPINDHGFVIYQHLVGSSQTVRNAYIVYTCIPHLVPRACCATHTPLLRTARWRYPMALPDGAQCAFSSPQTAHASNQLIRRAPCTAPLPRPPSVPLPYTKSRSWQMQKS